jgi:mono/diheme cytochrome c family protein
MRFPRPSAALLAGAAVLLCGAPVRAADAHPVVPGFERFHAAKPDAIGGQLLLGELNCVSCHQPEGKAAKRQAPVLDNVATRARVGWLRRFLAEPHAVKPGGAMPDLFTGDPEKAAKVEALVHFLASTGVPKQERADLKGALLGRDLYSKVGCAVCHGPRDLLGNAEKVLPAAVVPLGDLKAKYTIASLAAFLADPLASRPSGRMPHLLVAKDAKDVANYLAQGSKVRLPTGKGSTSYAYFEGDWANLPDFSKMKPAATGTGPAFDLSSARRDNNYGLRFEGVFRVERDGNYTFTLASDDGSQLFIDGKRVVNNDGIHAPQSASGSAELKKGVRKVVVQFMQGGGGAELAVEIDGPGLGRQPLGALVATDAAALDRKPEPVKKADPEDSDALDIKPELVQKGKELFAAVGCANCHQMNSDKKPVAPTLMAPALAKLKPAGGCLAEQPAKGLPRYELSAAQRQALAAAIEKPPAEVKEPAALVARAMTTFNCYACHARDKVGGPTEETNKFFQTTQPEMGDEGRVPPPLDLVGAKLNPDYLRQILDKGAHDRPYMHTRMPGFGAANVGELVTLFAALDKLPKTPEVAFTAPDAKVKSAARHLVGEQALACIKCHTFNGVKAEGIQGIDMTLMPKRLQHDWYYLYLLEPQKIRPGTRMPSSWPDGQTLLPKVLDGSTAQQINSIWVYLKQGGSAALPLGMGKKSIPLVPTTSAIVYRNFIQGAGARGIGVGYPEKVNVAFDANELRLAMIWQGAFIDAARHWTDRGVGFEGPLGDNVMALPANAPFAVLAKTDAPWPTASAREQGYKFLGYDLTPDERPTFRYSFGAIKIEDFPNPAGSDKEPALKRTLKLEAPPGETSLYFRAAVGAKIEGGADGWFKIDGWKLKVESSVAPVIRQSNGKQELLVPVTFKDGKAQVGLEYVW